MADFDSYKDDAMVSQLDVNHDAYEATSFFSVSTLVDGTKAILPTVSEKRVDNAIIFHDHEILDQCFLICSSLLPSFALRTGREQHVAENAKLHLHSYMDGIRGIASLCVFIHHIIGSWFHDLERGYLCEPKQISIFQLPFIRLIHTGWFQVAVFFVLSGYVLSLKPLALIRTAKTTELLNSLSGSVFRRAIRLFVPVIFMTVVATIGVYFDVQNKNMFTGAKYPRLDSLYEYYEVWTIVVYDLLQPYSWQPATKLWHSPHLWTAPTEFRGSMMVYIFLLGLARTKCWVRMSVIGAFLYYSMTRSQWECSLFLSGILLAELRLVSGNSTTSLYHLLERLVGSDPRRTKTAVFSCLLALALYIASFPQRDAITTPGYIALAEMTPLAYQTEDLRVRFWNLVAAILMLYSLDNCKILQRPLNHIVVQYFGKISFALYIVHVPLGFSITSFIYLHAMYYTDSYIIGWFIGTLLIFPLTIWVADLYWRAVDVRSVAFARWLLRKCSV